MKSLKISLSMVMALALASCGVSEAYLQADSDTFDAIAPDYRAYVMADDSLTPSDKETYLRTVKIWADRIKEAKKALVK